MVLENNICSQDYFSLVDILLDFKDVDIEIYEVV